jgi:hypothetical protein
MRHADGQRDETNHHADAQDCIERKRTRPPSDFALQVQTGFLVTGRNWCDFVSYSGGLPMTIIAVYPDPVVGDAIVQASGEFERRLAVKMQQYQDVLASKARLIPTERRVEMETTL